MPPKPQAVALRIELCDIQPLIWRRIVVFNHWTLASLHHYVQWVMGWQDTHAHEFRWGAHIGAPDWWIREVAGDADTGAYRDELRVSVAAIVADVGHGGAFEYVYDMGDDWCHRLVVESVPPAWTNGELRLPSCTAGENACPPEDVGGPPGYGDFLRVIADPQDKQFADRVCWIGGVFGPKGFDLNRINRDWQRAKRRRR